MGYGTQTFPCHAFGGGVPSESLGGAFGDMGRTCHYGVGLCQQEGDVFKTVTSSTHDGCAGAGADSTSPCDERVVIGVETVA